MDTLPVRMDSTLGIQVGAHWEKTGPLNVRGATNHHAAHKRLYRHGMWTLFAVLVYLTTFSFKRQTHVELTPPKGATVFNWADITPSKELNWKKCYEGPDFYCARLEVPLDYAEPDGEKATVALVKLASKLSSKDAKYRGPILFNPGGPGGSGVAMLLRNGYDFRKIIGHEFDYVSFDPRGVGFTTPYLGVFQTRQEAGLSWMYEKGLNQTASTLGAFLSNAKVVGDIAASRSRKYAEHVSTPVVARDMLSIVKTHGLDKLQYWGFSYGTVLGATFAAMFPENVGRLIIDGVEDSENYYDTLWDNNFVDTDAALLWYYNECVKSGPQACPIYEPTVEKIQERVLNLLERLKTEPVAFFNSSTGAHGVVDYSAVKTQLFQALYSPSSRGLGIARSIAALESGDAEPIWNTSLEAAVESMVVCDCSAGAETNLDSSVASSAIACGDGRRVDDGLDDLKEYYEELAKKSMFADLWGMRASCAGWKIVAKEQFKGKFVANTNHPLLLIGNTADPVTPLQHAYKMSKGFNGSVVLKQNSPGHCSVSATSLCTAKIVREYFRNGTLPEEGTVCEVESTIFGDGQHMSAFMQTLSADDLEIFEGSRALQLNYFVPPFM